jgi:hypothetical protein
MANDYKVEYGAYGAADTGTAVVPPVGASTVDLRAQAGCPTYCPQRLLLNVTGAGTIVVKDRAGKSITLTLPIGVFDIPMAVATFEQGTAVAVAHVFWWVDATTRYNA